MFNPEIEKEGECAKQTVKERERERERERDKQKEKELHLSFLISLPVIV